MSTGVLIERIKDLEASQTLGFERPQTACVLNNICKLKKDYIISSRLISLVSSFFNLFWCLFFDCIESESWGRIGNSSRMGGEESKGVSDLNQV